MATELGKAYVQIVPSAKGISGAIENIVSPEAKRAGKSAGGSIAGTIKKVLATAAIGKALFSSVMEGGKLEQSLGGIKTLFKGSAEKVKQQAQEAFRTTGLSANAYMENVTGFSASLLQSLEGDTEKAAEISNMAMIDMADNSNKMGSSMESIQNAYQGFAKQNYTMLDNLKLGYGGTNSEMERLLADATKLTGVKYDINNLSDVYKAIHAVQNELGITGTTAKEASTTLTGSFNAMKGAFSNFLGALALGEGVKPALIGLSETVSTFLFGNLIPMVITIFKSLPEAIVAFFQSMGPMLLQYGQEIVSTVGIGVLAKIPEFISSVNEFLQQAFLWIQQNLPQFLQQGKAILSSIRIGVLLKVPEFLSAVNEFLQQAILWIQQNLPEFLQQGVAILSGIVNGLLSSIPMILDAVWQIISTVFEAILLSLPQLMQIGFDLIANLAQGIVNNLPAIAESINQITNDIFQMLSESLPGILQKGVEIVESLAKGIWDNLPKIMETIGSVLENLLRNIEKYGPDLLREGIEIIAKIARGIWDNLPTIITTIGNVLSGLLQKIAEHGPQLLQKGVELLGEMAAGIVKAIPDIVGKVPGIIAALIGAFAGFIGDFIDMGFRLLEGLGQGIANAVGNVVGAAIDAAKNVLDSVLGFFGIHSPSRVFAEIGKYLDLGLAGGIEGNMKPVTRAVEALGEEATGAFESDLAFALDTSMNPLSSGLTPALSGAGAGGNYNVTMYNTISSDYDVDKAIRKLDEGLAGLASEKERGRGVR